MQLVDVTYKCKCSAEPVEVHIPARKKDEDTSDFWNRVQEAARMDHQSRKPRCKELFAEVTAHDYETVEEA